jgi:hypothetical protein
MPIAPFLRGKTFDPEVVEAISVAFQKTCDALGLADHTGPIATLVAQNIIRLAQRGIHDPNGLHLMATENFKNNLQ